MDVLLSPVTLALLGALLSLLVNFIKSAAERRHGLSAVQPEERLEEQLTAVFHSLEENSHQAAQLLTRLESEVATRHTAIQEIETKLQGLRQQRALLELTPEQQQAIEGLVRRPSSLRSIFTSLDFWVARFGLSFTFFVLGLLAGWLGLR